MTLTIQSPLGCDSGAPCLRFSGYAALFDVADAGGDVIRRGAFAGSLARLRDGGEQLPLLWQHRPEQQIGWVETIAEDARGLRVIARLAPDAGVSAHLLEDGEVRGLSFGYRALDARGIALPGGHPGRELNEIDLFEVSLVTHPMQPAAGVILVI